MRDDVQISTLPTKRLKYLVTLRRSPVTESGEALPYIGLENIAPQTGRLVGDVKISDTTTPLVDEGNESSGIYFEGGDVLFGKLRPYLMKAWVAEFPGRCTTEALVMTPHTIEPRFLRNVCLSSPFIDSVDASTFGSKMPRAEWSFIGNMPVPVPAWERQHAIADYLDRETARLDALVAAKERLLDLLAEKRQALISHAVTRGLDPTAPMRDSDVPWLGEIPVHWEVGRAAWLFRERNERSVTGDEELLTVSHITGVTPRSEKEVHMFEAQTTEGYKLCMRGDLVINTFWAWMGAMGIAPIDGIVSPSYHVYKANERLDFLYMDYIARLPVFAQEVARYSKGVWSSRLSLYPEEFFQILLPIPSLKEQQQIVSVLKTQVAKLDKYQAITKHTIDLLKERRAALVSAAVTGQIDVGDAA